MEAKLLSVLFSHPGVIYIHVEKNERLIKGASELHIYFSILGEEYLIQKADENYIVYYEESFGKIKNSNHFEHFLDRVTTEHLVEHILHIKE